MLLRVTHRPALEERSESVCRIAGAITGALDKPRCAFTEASRQQFRRSALGSIDGARRELVDRRGLLGWRLGAASPRDNSRARPRRPICQGRWLDGSVRERREPTRRGVRSQLQIVRGRDRERRRGGSVADETLEPLMGHRSFGMRVCRRRRPRWLLVARDKILEVPNGDCPALRLDTVERPVD